MKIANFSLIKIDSDTIIKPFDCGDDDLNSFLLEKSINYSSEFLATTYLLEDSKQTIAFFSIFNDSVRMDEIQFSTKSALKRLLSNLLPFPKKHLKSFPAIKIGRLAVSNQIQSQGIGKEIIQSIINLGILQNKTCACRFISVDAYSKSSEFYTKMKFKYFTDNDSEDETRQMYLDLIPILHSRQ